MVAFSQNATQLKIIAEKYRPLPESFINNPKALESFTTNTHFKDVSDYKTHLANLIATLESAFPGQKYGFLGRDMFMIADAVDAYYIKKGQPGRVAWIPFSTPSMNGATDASVLGLFEGLGVDSSKSKTPNGFVMVDYTSFSGTPGSPGASQSRFIYRAIVRAMKAKGLKPADIVERFNVMTIQQSDSETRINPRGKSKSQMSAIKAKIAASLVKGEDPSHIFKAVAGDMSMAYGVEWHSTFGPIQKVGREYKTEPNGFFSDQQKTATFSRVIEVLRYAVSKEFISKADAQLAKHGIKLVPTGKAPRTPTIAVEPDAKEVKLSADEKMISEVKTLRTLPVLGKDYDYEKTVIGDEKVRLTENGQKVASILTSEDVLKAPKYFEVSTLVIITLYKENKIGSRDARRLLEIALSQGRMTTAQKTAVTEIIKKNSTIDPIFTMFAGGRVREKLSTSEDAILKANYNGLVAQTAIKLSCRTVY